jgi:hypothetical protein
LLFFFLRASASENLVRRETKQEEESKQAPLQKRLDAFAANSRSKESKNEKKVPTHLC